MKLNQYFWKIRLGSQQAFCSEMMRHLLAIQFQESVLCYCMWNHERILTCSSPRRKSPPLWNNSWRCRGASCPTWSHPPCMSCCCSEWVQRTQSPCELYHPGSYLDSWRLYFAYVNNNIHETWIQEIMSTCSEAHTRSKIWSNCPNKFQNWNLNSRHIIIIINVMWQNAM